MRVEHPDNASHDTSGPSTVSASGHLSIDAERSTLEVGSPELDLGIEDFQFDPNVCTVSFEGIDEPAEGSVRMSCELGQYRLIEKIGQGGMGSVYRAVHQKLKKQFAVKVLPPHRMRDPRAIARFHREMEAVGRLDHANIVRATDAGEFKGVHYLVMELVDGIDLARLLQAHGPLPLADACELTRQAAAGLQSAHESQLVHRDIKPSNLLLADSGQVKILDLGLARLTIPDDEESNPELSQTGLVMGTPDYMAPEQWSSCHETDIRSDLYSLGCTLYALLVGRPPFQTREHDSKTKKMAAHLRDAPQPITQLRRDLPSSVSAIVEKLLSKEPGQRYQTPLELQQELARYCGGADLKSLARTGTAAYRGKPIARAPVRKPRRWWLVGAVGVAVIAIGLLLRSAFFSGSGEVDGGGAEVVVDDGGLPVDGRVEQGVWYDLLARKPKAIVWPNDLPGARWEYDAKNRSLLVDCPKLAMFELGSFPNRDFEVEATLYQNPWNGYFGMIYQANTTPGSAGGKLVGLEKFLPENTPNPARMFHGHFLSKDMINVVLNRDSTVKFPTPKARPYPFGFQLRAGKLARVTWDGQPVEAAFTRFGDLAPEAAAPNNVIGLFLRESSATFSNLKVRFLPPQD